MIIIKILQSIISDMRALGGIVLVLLVWRISARCDDSIQCFKSKLFNFDSPGEGIYALPEITNTVGMSKQYNIVGYGDFDNNLYTDFIAQFTSNASLAIFLWNTQSSNFVIQTTASSTLVTSQCTPQSVYLYDMDINGLLDIVVWGSAGGQNCLLPFIHQPDFTFAKGAVLAMPNTSNPFVIAYGTNNNAQRSIALLAYMNGQRTILKYNGAGKNFTSVQFSQVFQSANSFAATPFADPHWNSYLDLTGDCRSDVVIVDQNKNIQFWVNDGPIFRYQNSTTGLGNFTSLSFNDMNYNGAVDMIVAHSNAIQIFLNLRQLSDQNDFCVTQHTKVGFNSTAAIILTFDSAGTMSPGTLQIKDINMDGYPDFLVPLNTGNSYQVMIYLSQQCKQFNLNQQYKLPTQTFPKISYVSFIDFLQNGIMDFVIGTQNGTYAFYNNYLQQNLFFIKGYGASGANTTSGAQIIGASFYWINSVGEGYRTTFQAQIPQTAYNALQTPFAYCGLGRANNYVESFTLGVFGDYQSWSPIIPNSQLAVYAPGAESKDWGIRIYVLPTESLIYVVIVSAIILTVFGIILAVLKCKNHKKRDEPLMEFIH